ncbi:MAG: hypothetical protein LBI15_05465 [Dysgonamonadaceae bacterium]|jgi:hypothetical protein|nr:hypothetical protein [Dysgonamonadaceae bacterium]
MAAKIRKNIIPKKIAKSKTIFFRDFDGIDNLINWINTNRVNSHDYKKHLIKILNINFSRVRHLKPYHITPLSCLIHEYQSKGFKIKVRQATDLINGYLNSFDFGQFCDKKHQNCFLPTKDPKTFPLWKIEENKIALYPNEIEKYFERNHFNGKSLSSLSISLAEMLNNVFDHSDSFIPGYTFTQYNSQTKSIIISVCDFGIGIPNKVNGYLQSKKEQLLSNADALEKAFQNSFSTKSKPHNRGFGWDNILSNVKSLNGRILVLSNNCLYVSNQKGIFERSVYFPGTLVVIWLDTRNLPEQEEELTVEMDLF